MSAVGLRFVPTAARRHFSRQIAQKFGAGALLAQNEVINIRNDAPERVDRANSWGRKGRILPDMLVVRRLPRSRLSGNKIFTNVSTAIFAEGFRRLHRFDSLT